MKYQFIDGEKYKWTISPTMAVHLEKISLHLQPVGDGDKDHKLAMKGEEQEDGSLILRLSVVDKSGKPLPLRWKGDFDEDKCEWIEEKE